MTQDSAALHSIKHNKTVSVFELRFPTGKKEEAIRLRISMAGDAALIIYIDADELLLANQIIKLLTKAVLDSRPAYLQEYIPSYKSLYLEFNLLEVDIYAARAFVLRCLSGENFLHHLARDVEAYQHGKMDLGHNTLHRIPVCYESIDLPNDLEKVAKETSLPRKALIATHCASQLRVFATGFLPGFAYLGEIDESIQIARLSQPRARVPAGAVAIADKQTAIYPMDSPGGWHILGYTPISLISKSHENSLLLKVGDQIQFYEISAKEYHSIRAKQAVAC